MDLVILGSDGVFDNLYFHEIIELIDQHPVPDLPRIIAEKAQ